MVAKLTNVPTKQELHQMYVVERMSQNAIGNKYHCSSISIGRLLKKYGIPARHTGPLPGEEHPQWAGGAVVNKGYRYLYRPHHPKARRNRRRYILEHRLLMEEHLGRYLEDNEVVHHKNGDTLDNRIENLELYTTNALHLRSSLKGKCPNWSKDGRRRTLEGARKPRKPHPPAEVVADMYVREFLSIEEIAKRLNSSKTLVAKALDQSGVERRHGSPKYKWPPLQTVLALYETHTIREIVAEIGCSEPALYGFFARNGIVPYKSKQSEQKT